MTPHSHSTRGGGMDFCTSPPPNMTSTKHDHHRTPRMQRPLGWVGGLSIALRNTGRCAVCSACKNGWIGVGGGAFHAQPRVERRKEGTLSEPPNSSTNSSTPPPPLPPTRSQRTAYTSSTNKGGVACSPLEQQREGEGAATSPGRGAMVERASV